MCIRDRFYIIDYLWSGFTGLSVAMMVVALWAWGSAVFGEFMLPAPADVFQKADVYKRQRLGCDDEFAFGGDSITFTRK